MFTSSNHHLLKLPRHKQLCYTHTHSTQALILKCRETGSHPSSVGYLGTIMTEMVPGLQGPVRRHQIPKSKMGNTLLTEQKYVLSVLK